MFSVEGLCAWVKVSASEQSIVNLSVLKNHRAKAIRYSTLRAICETLHCEVGGRLVMPSN